MKGYGIYVKNDLLDKKHLEAFGTSPLWLYLWLLDKMTSIGEDGIGKVLGGKPITYSEVEDELGLSERSYKRYIKLLRDNGYIETTRTMYGLVILVNRASKIFGNSNRDRPKMAHPDRPKMAKRSAKVAHPIGQSGTSNKTIQYDNTIVAKATKPLAYGNDEINKIYDYWEKQCGMPLPANKANRYATNNLLKKYNSDKLKSLIRGVAQAQGDRYAPTIGDMVALQAKVNDLLIWAKKNNQGRIVKI